MNDKWLILDSEVKYCDQRHCKICDLSGSGLPNN